MKDPRRVARIVVLLALLAVAFTTVWTLYSHSSLSDADKTEIAAAIERYNEARAIATEWPVDCARDMRIPDDVGAQIQRDYEEELRAATTPRQYDAAHVADIAAQLDEWRHGDEFYLIVGYRDEVLELALASGLRFDGDTVVVEVSERASEKILPSEVRDGTVVAVAPVDPARATWRTYPAHNFRYTLRRIDGVWRVDDSKQLPPFG